LFDTLVGFFALPGGRRIDTYAARDCRNLSNRLAVDWQKTMEITPSLFFVKFSSKTIIQNPERNIKCFELQDSVRFKGNAGVILIKKTKLVY
jgi:hypothetical protein